MTTMTRQALPRKALLLLVCLLITGFSNGSGFIDVESRHEASLSTFDTAGRLLQVEYAMEAAAMGTPVVVVCRPGIGMFMAAPQVLPHAFVLDDGTARFARVTNNLMVSHSGISADGRVLVAACQEMAIQHEYVYDESIPLDIFLEEMSLLYQEHTMKPAVRPFGATLIVADHESDSFYRIDPSGAVECLGNHAVINGDTMQTDNKLLEQLHDIAGNESQSTLQEVGDQVVEALKDALKRTSTGNSTVVPSNVRRILTASISDDEGMVFDRHELSQTLSEL